MIVDPATVDVVINAAATFAAATDSAAATSSRVAFTAGVGMA